MKTKIYQNLRLFVTAFGLGILMMGVVYLWDNMQVPYQISAIGLLLFTLYSFLAFASASAPHSKKTNNE